MNTRLFSIFYLFVHTLLRFLVLFVVKKINFLLLCRYVFWFFLASSKRSTSFVSDDTVFGSFWRRQKDLPLSLLLVRFLVLFVVSKKINHHSIVLCTCTLHVRYKLHFCWGNTNHRLIIGEP